MSWVRRLSDPVDRPPRAVLDSDVIFSRVLHELLGRVAAELRLLTLVWSDELLAEAERTLILRKPMPEQAARRWAGYLREAFPAERVDLADLPAGINLGALTTDPDDQHVCALAIAGHVELLFTFDRGYLQEPLREHGITVLTPDDFLVAAFDDHPSALLEVLRSQAAVWGGGRPVGELVDAIERARAPLFARRVRDAPAGRSAPTPPPQSGGQYRRRAP